MKNLKKVLALVLAFACAFTMFAGAAFTDSADIKVDTEVVDTLVSLGVVNGYDDGSFKPNGTVTRAEMAKMIYVLRTGNSDASAYNDDKTSFTDIGSHWARGYIKYCQSLGIIAGKSNTKFCPNDKVTAQEAAKMLLVTLGYNAEKAGLVGANWASKTNALADEAGLLEDVNTSFTSACPRQYAAQIIYNAIDAHTVVIRDGEYTNMALDGKSYLPTVGAKYMNLADEHNEGVLTSVKKEDNKDTYRLSVAGVTGNFTKVANDYSSLLGQKVKVLYKNDDQSKVYGVFATDDNLSVTVQKDDIDDLDKTPANKFKINGTEYKSTADNANNIPVYYAPDMELDSTHSQKDTTLGALADYETVTLVDNNDDDKIDLAVVAPITFVQISYLSKTNVGLDVKGGAALSETSFDLEDDDVVLYDGAKEDDYAVVVNGAYTVDGNTTITKAEVVNGEVTATKGSISDVKVGGNWYSIVSGTCSAVKLNKTFDLAVYGKFAFAAEKTAGSATAEDILFIDKAAAITSGVSKSDNNVEAKAYFTDGTSKTITISKVTKADDSEVDATAFASDATDEQITAAFANKMFLYELDGSEYKLTVLSDTNEKLGYDNYIAKTTSDGAIYMKDGKITVGNSNVMRMADDAVVFVKTDDEIKVVTGKSVANWAEIKLGSSKTITNTSALTDDSNGYKYVQVGSIVLSGTDDVPGASDYLYGYVVSKPESSKNGSTNYTSVKIWNGTEEVTVTGKTSDMSGIAKGQFIRYSQATEEYIKVEDTKTVADAVAITGFDTDSVNGSDYADKYALIGVNTKNITGVTGVKVDTAKDVATNAAAKYCNAVIFYEDNDAVNGDVEAIFVDSNGKMYPSDANTYDDTTAMTTNTVLALGTVTGLPTASQTVVEVNGTYTVSGLSTGLTAAVTKAEKKNATSGTAGTVDEGDVWTATLTVTAANGYKLGTKAPKLTNWTVASESAAKWVYTLDITVAA